MRFRELTLLGLAAALFAQEAPRALATEGNPTSPGGDSVSPYIDQIKEGMEKREEAAPSEPGAPDPYIQSVRRKMQERGDGPEEGAGASTHPYIDRLKEGIGPQEEHAPGRYLEEEKAKLDTKEEPSAIQAVREGHSELEAKKKGKIHGAFGLRYGAFLTRNVSSGSQLQGFDAMYGGNYAPDVSLFYEYQPFHSEWFGNVGIVGSLGVSYYHGSGVFQFPLTNPVTHQAFSPQSNTLFQFFAVPLMAGLDYRFNLARILRPFVMAGPTLIGMVEARDDGISGNRSYSTGLYAGGGASLLLDWLMPETAWDLYASHGVQHYYLTLEYGNLSTLSGDVSYNVQGGSVGLTFEF